MGVVNTSSLSSSRAILVLASAEWGEDFQAFPGRACARVARLGSARPIPTAGAYVARVRAILAARGIDPMEEGREATDPLRGIRDGRLLAAGFNRLAPSVLATELPDWLAYWRSVAERPGTVGSCYNPSPEDVFAAWRQKVPARLARRVDLAATRGVHCAHPRFRALAALPAVGLPVGPATPTALLRRMAHLPRGFWAWAQTRDRELLARQIRPSGAWAQTVAWERIPALWREWRTLPVEALRVAGPPALWPEFLAEHAPARWAAWERALRDAPSAVRPRLVTAICTIAGRAVCHDALSELVRASAYPCVPEASIARLALGERPVDLAPGLTAHEAHEWLLGGGHGSPVAYLAARIVPEEHRDAAQALRAIPVVRWYAAVVRDPARREALYRTREIQGPHGETVRVRYVDRVDEIDPGDLAAGPRTSVERAFERAAERVTVEKLAELARQHETLAPPPPWWRPLPAWTEGARFAALLRTPAELVAEGNALGHCVGGYVEYVRRRESAIVALAFGGERSTAELSWEEGTVKQHKGRNNSVPSERHERALRVLLRWCGIPLP